MQLDDIKKLAILARIDMDENEMAEIANDFNPILAYVGQVQEISNLNNISNKNSVLSNIMRDDIVTNKEGSYSNKIIAEMPNSQDGFLKVKQIL
jgi:aspartyl-tRNA(Asn)/glutamyl-tRNA(Gln) amidotransferase subunit C